MSQMMQHSLNCPAQHAELPQGKMKSWRHRRRGRGEGASSITSGQKKRRLSAEQARMLELNFRSEQKLETARKERLATALGLEPQQVAVWFQNRRVKWKSKQLEHEYMRLKNTHQAMLAQKCMLEQEVLKLREQLSVAQEETRKISDECYNIVGVQDERSCIPSSSLSMYATDNLFEDFGNNFLHTPDQLITCYNINGWMKG